MELAEVIEGIEAFQSQYKIRNWGYVLSTKQHQELRRAILEHTGWMRDQAGLVERMYCIMYDIRSYKSCKVCGYPIVKFVTYECGYGDYCSMECSGRCPERIDKQRATCLERYGATHLLLLKEVQAKGNQTRSAQCRSKKAKKEPVVSPKYVTVAERFRRNPR